MKRALAVVILVSLLAAAAWWLFGWRTERFGKTSITAYRFFGRDTLLEMDFNGDGRIDEWWHYTWRHPSVHHELPHEQRVDRNFDGRVDTWIYPENLHSMNTRARFVADLDGDGDGDWAFVDSWTRGGDRIRKRRGY